MTQEKWHVTKSINISHIFATMVMLVGGFMYIANIDKEVAKNTIHIKTVSERVSSLDSSHNIMFDRIDTKLDKLFDLMYDLKSND